MRECCRRYAILCYVRLTRSVDCLAGFGSFTLRQVRETSLHVLVAHTNFQTYIHKHGGWYPPLVTITPTGSLCRWHPLIGGVAWFVSVPVSSLLARGTLPLNGTHDLLGRISTLLLSGLVRCRMLKARQRPRIYSLGKRPKPSKPLRNIPRICLFVLRCQGISSF